MDIFHYHHITGEYLGVAVADPDPLILGSFLVPAWTTPIKPPASGVNEVAVFDGTDWALFSDFRGAIYYLPDGSSHQITDIGVTVPAQASSVPPIYYEYDHLTGEYIGTTTDHTVKPNVTLLAVPAVVQNQAAVFDGTKWSVKPDYRGTVWDTVTGAAIQHSDIGPLPNHLTTLEKPAGFYHWDGQDWVADYAKARSSKVAELKSICSGLIVSGCDHDALGSIHHYPTTKDDQAFMAVRFSKAQALGASGEPYKFMCADSLGNWARRDHTAAQIIAVALAIEAHITAILNHLDGRLSTLNSVPNDLAQIAAFGW